MPVWVWVVVVILAVASRPIEVRLWRAGKLSDRTLAALLLARLPALATFAVIANGASLPVALLLIGSSLLSPLLFYRFVLGVIQEQSRRAN